MGFFFFFVILIFFRSQTNSERHNEFNNDCIIYLFGELSYIFNWLSTYFYLFWTLDHSVILDLSLPFLRCSYFSNYFFFVCVQRSKHICLDLYEYTVNTRHHLFKIIIIFILPNKLYHTRQPKFSS